MSYTFTIRYEKREPLLHVGLKLLIEFASLLEVEEEQCLYDAQRRSTRASSTILFLDWIGWSSTDNEGYEIEAPSRKALTTALEFLKEFSLEQLDSISRGTSRMLKESGVQIIATADPEQAEVAARFIAAANAADDLLRTIQVAAHDAGGEVSS